MWYPRTLGFASGIAGGKVVAIGKSDPAHIRTFYRECFLHSACLFNEVRKVVAAVREKERAGPLADVGDRTGRLLIFIFGRSEEAWPRGEARVCSEIVDARNGKTPLYLVGKFGQRQ